MNALVVFAAFVVKEISLVSPHFKDLLFKVINYSHKPLPVLHVIDITVGEDAPEDGNQGRD